jgi:hypothetical protein
VDLLREAGFGKVETRPRHQRFRSLEGLVRFLLEERGTLADGYKYLFELGVLDRQTIESAREELKVWQADDARYLFYVNLLTIASA